MERIRQIRLAEEKSHTEAYSSLELFVPGSWLAKPVKTVMDLPALFEGYSEFCGLDLGCGIGRNCIPVARHFASIPCRVDCVDILQLAIEKLREYAGKYQVSGSIQPIHSPMDSFVIRENSYDLIMAVSALEHMESREIFEKKLQEIRRGLRDRGVVCLIVNSGVTERDKESGEERYPQFEVNLPTEQMERLLTETFAGWEIVKHTVVHQKYDIPREGYISALETDVVTLVARKPEPNGQNKEK